jgi:hypothetical protein
MRGTHLGDVVEVEVGVEGEVGVGGAGILSLRASFSVMSFGLLLFSGLLGLLLLLLLLLLFVMLLGVVKVSSSSSSRPSWREGWVFTRRSFSLSGPARHSKENNTYKATNNKITIHEQTSKRKGMYV